jgi:predicted hydrolase (HD superfamily)
MMTPLEAESLVEEKLGQSPRAAHSRQVGQVLGALATHLAADVRLWTAVGLVHDIDYFAVGEDMTQHGVLAAAWLEGRLPQDALEAIAAHDRSTGITSASLLADMLKLADALAIFIEALGIEALARDHRGHRRSSPNRLERSAQSRCVSNAISHIISLRLKPLVAPFRYFSTRYSDWKVFAGRSNWGRHRLAWGCSNE